MFIKQKVTLTTSCGFFFCHKSSSVEGEVNIMRIYDSLTPSVRSELIKLSNGIKYHPKVKTSHRQFKERLTRREVEELMGTNRDRYHRVNGKVRRK